MKIISKLSQSLYSLSKNINHSVGFSQKLEDTFKYRQSWASYLTQKKNQAPKLWIHGASVGELEDLSSFFLNSELLDLAGYSFEKLILTSSSVSAKNRLLDWKKKYAIHYAGPLPPEKITEANHFIDQLNPDLFVLSQSDTWPCIYSTFKNRIHKGGIWIPHKNQSASFFKQSVLSHFVKKVLTRDPSAPLYFKHISQEFIGNPRLDRIFERLSTTTTSASKTKNDYFHLIVGSAWKEDIQNLSYAFSKRPPETYNKYIISIYPHEIGNMTEIATIKALLPKANLILEEGKLLEAYTQADLALVGGGWRTGLHNIIEPIAAGIPTICGPNLIKQADAPRMIQQKALVSTKNHYELAELFARLTKDSTFFENWKLNTQKTQEQLKKECGASRKVAEHIKKL